MNKINKKRLDKVFAIIFFLFSVTNYCQSNFSEGFENGYKEGYCYNSGPGCISPNPPVSPVPSTFENYNSYKDGYNRGFQTALYARKNSTDSSNQGGYKATESTFIDGAMYNSIKRTNINDVIELANAIRLLKDKIFVNLENENFYGAIKLAELGLDIVPSDSEFPLVLGQAYLGLGNEKESLKWYKIAQKRKYRKPIAQRINDIENGYYSKKRKKTQSISKNKIFKSYETSFDNPVFEKSIYEKPKLNSKVLYKCPKDAKILVIEDVNEFFLKVKVNGHTGYTTKSFVKLE